MSHDARIAIVILAAIGTALGGCTPTVYFGNVTAHLVAQPVDDPRNAVRALPGLHGPVTTRGANPGCGYLEIQLPRTGLRVPITECHGSDRSSDTGWAYWGGTSVARRQFTPDVKLDLEQLLEEIRQLINTPSWRQGHRGRQANVRLVKVAP